MRLLKRSAKKICSDKVAQEARLSALEEIAEQSRKALHIAANDTKEIVEDITLQLRSDLIDKSREMELTANIINDALLICDENGVVLTMNGHAETLLQRSCDQQEVNVHQHIKIAGDYWDALISSPHHAVVLRGDGTEATCTVNIARLVKSDGTNHYVVLLHQLLADEVLEKAQIISKGTLTVTDSVISGSNREIEEVLGYPANGLLGKSLIDLISPSDRTFVSKHLDAGNMETTFDTVLAHRSGKQLFAKMAITNVQDFMVVTVENITGDAVNRKVDVIRCFGEDFFFRSSTQIVPTSDMFMYLTPDFKIKYANELMTRRLVCQSRDLSGVPLEDVMTMTEYKVAVLHFQSLTTEDSERAVSIHLRNSNGDSYQEWTDRAFHDEHGNVIEYRRSGTVRPYTN